MRYDMKKVIVERERIKDHGDGKYHRKPKYGITGASHEGMKRPHKYKYGGKSLNENLSPLRRYLESKVGCNWDDVYSDICANLSVSSTIDQHVRGHIWDFVAKDYIVDDQGVIYNSKWGFSYRYYGLYVDSNNILRNTGPRPKNTYKEDRKKMIEQRYRVIGGVEYFKIQGIWYRTWNMGRADTPYSQTTQFLLHQPHVPYGKSGPTKYYEQKEMAIARNGLTDREEKNWASYARKYNPSDIIPISLKQLDRRTLKKLNLTND